MAVEPGLDLLILLQEDGATVPWARFTLRLQQDNRLAATTAEAHAVESHSRPLVRVGSGANPTEDYVPQDPELVSPHAVAVAAAWGTL